MSVPVQHTLYTRQAERLLDLPTLKTTKEVMTRDS